MTGTDRQAFAHDAVLAMAADGDDRAPGGAITVALCGSWSHEPPCPLAPHHTGVQRDGDEVTLRVLFAAAPDDESRVRALIDEALAGGDGEDPDGVRTAWRLTSSGPSPVLPEEQDHAGRLRQNQAPPPAGRLRQTEGETSGGSRDVRCGGVASEA